MRQGEEKVRKRDTEGQNKMEKIQNELVGCGVRGEKEICGDKERERWKRRITEAK